MIVGIPGVGFGGLFYLVTALAMPFREIGRRSRNQANPARWGVVATQATTAVAIIVALWATGWALGHALAPSTAAAAAAARTTTIVQPHNALKISALAWSVGMLAMLVLAVRVAHVVLRARDAIPRQRLIPMAPERRPASATVRPTSDQFRDTGTGGRRGMESGQYPRWRS